MNYNIYVYVISLFVTAYALSGVNFECIIKKGKVNEAKCLVMVLCLSLSYLLANFIISFISNSKII